MNPFTGDKLFQHLDRLAAWQKGELPPPVLVELDLTNLCNHACPGCTFSYLVNESKDSIPYDLAERVVIELAGFGVKAVTFSGGGEPLVYGEQRVLDLMRLAVDVGLEVALITNGALLTDLSFLSLCQWIRISLDGYDAETFSKYHGRKEGEFLKVVARTKELCRAAQVLRDGGRRCATVGVGYLTEPGNVKDFTPMAEFCAREFPGLDYLQFRPLVVNMVDDPTLTGGGWDRAGIDPCHWSALEAGIQEARAAAPDLCVLWSEAKYAALHRPAENFGINYSRCHGHFLEAVVSADCCVYVCCHTQGQERFKLGDLRTQTFAEIWHSEHAKQVLGSFDPRTTCPPACRLHTHNVTLEGLKAPVTHPNYL